MEAIETIWSRIVDRDLTPEQLSIELTADLLLYVKDEGAALDTISRTKLLISLLYLSQEKLDSLKREIESLFSVCDNDEEEWVRITASVMRKWIGLPVSEKDHALLKSAADILSIVKAAPAPPTDTPAIEKFVLPLVLCPDNWQYLALESLPDNFDVQGLDVNRHFSAKKRNPGEGIKRVKVIASYPSSNSNSTTVPTVGTVDRVPQKVKDLLATATLLSNENRERIIKFFNSPPESGVTTETEILITESRGAVEDKPGKIKIERSFIWLDPVSIPMERHT